MENPALIREAVEALKSSGMSRAVSRVWAKAKPGLEMFGRRRANPALNKKT